MTERRMRFYDNKSSRGSQLLSDERFFTQPGSPYFLTVAIVNIGLLMTENS